MRETSPECPSCRLTLARADALLGPVPQLEGEVSDTAGVLGKRGRARVIAALEELGRRFPQLSAHVLLKEFPLEHPFEVQVFWLFNTAGFFTEDTKGDRNHGILLVLDPSHGRSALTLGYGLEPFVGDEALDHLLELAEPSWQQGDYPAGILVVLRKLGTLLGSIADELPNALGIPPETAEKVGGDS